MLDPGVLAPRRRCSVRTPGPRVVPRLSLERVIGVVVISCGETLHFHSRARGLRRACRIVAGGLRGTLAATHIPRRRHVQICSLARARRGKLAECFRVCRRRTRRQAVERERMLRGRLGGGRQKRVRRLPERSGGGTDAVAALDTWTRRVRGQRGARAEMQEIRLQGLLHWRARLRLARPRA